jgi:fibro-slime domain-containing protein
MRLVSLTSLTLSVASLLLGACARIGDPVDQAGLGGHGGTGAGAGGRNTQHDAGPPPDRGAPEKPRACGNGERTSDEACDDGNTVSGDGCSGDCLTVEPGYSCTPVGQPCHRVARCGDGVVVPPELCDDGNTTAGDGCSATCKIELGYKCNGNPSVCTPTKCGDGVIEGAESCEDGNAFPFDGCSADCQSEPNCTGATCVSKCGDGLVVNEACDDGNTIDGDGCSSTCTIEPGFMCSQPALGDKMLVPVIYRDFRAQHPADFEAGVPGQTMALTGIVQNMLDADGKPVYSGNVPNAHTTTATFAQWYRNVDGVNHATASKMPLWSNGMGAYVNRYGANGEQWIVTTPAYYCGNVGREKTDPTTGLPIPCTSIDASMTDCSTALAMGYTILNCTTSNGNYVATIQTGTMDGTPLFFPVDSDTFTPLDSPERVAATIPPPYIANWPFEAGKPLHNFSFTSEIRYWFKYDATKTYTLDFTGDDDVWLFVNKQLAVDLGGIHAPVQGSVTFGGTAAAKFGLKDGQVYEAAVFQAERQTNSSSYRLTLSGFNAAPSECVPICGDGILGLGEECDDGVNAGGYGECGPGCKLGPYCGDGIVQPAEEDCDDGVNIGNPCPSGCRNLIVP